MTDSSEIGRFGTLRLLKRHDPNTTIAFFPVDDEEVTFGRSNNCSVRLYYAFVSEVHCILQISEERKAFLIVKGSNGVTIDGCEVLPTPGQTQDPVVPLTNGSEIEIHTKKFRFEYPPKEIRAALLATPRPSPSSNSSSNSRRRSLRMSMIASAQVFTPRKGNPSSPLKTSLRAHYQGSPSSQLIEEDGKGECEDQWDALKSPVKVPSFLSEEHEALLIQGSGEEAVVVEEDKDLIILEHVDEQDERNPVSQVDHPTKVNSPVPKSLPTTVRPMKSATVPTTPTTQTRPSSISSSPALKPQAFQTPPHNRRRSGISLHRAVVLRSAHRAHREQEMQRTLEQAQNEEEEEEVELAVSPERDLGPFELCDNDDDGGGEIGKELWGDDGDAEDDKEDGVENGKSEDEDEEEENSGESATYPTVSPSRSTYPGPFETLKAGFEMVKKLTFEKSPERVPQRDIGQEDVDKFRSPSPVRRLLTDFMTPQAATSKSKLPQRLATDATKPKQTFARGEPLPSLFGGARRVPVLVTTSVEKGAATSSHLNALSQQTPGTARPQISREEREAIYERRRSALLRPTAILPPPGPRPSIIKPKIGEEEEYMPGKDGNEDSETMLERMKAKLENVQRRSEARKGRASYASPQHTRGYLDYGTDPLPSLSLLPPPVSVGVQSRTLRMAEESLRRMKLEDDEDDGEDDDEDEKKVTTTPTHRPHSTSSRTWIAAAAAQTPSFVGMRDMFKTEIAMATPNMKLDEIFYEIEDDEDEDEGRIDHADELDTVDADEPVNTKPSQSPLTSTSTLVGKTASRLTSRRGVRRKIPERTSPEGNVGSEPTHPTRRATRRAAVEPLIEVQNSHCKIEDDSGIVSSTLVSASTRRVTRSRNVKSVNEETESAVPTAKRATRQTKKQQVEHTEEPAKTRRSGQTKKQVAVQSKQDDADAPKLTQRRRTRPK